MRRGSLLRSTLGPARVEPNQTMARTKQTKRSASSAASSAAAAAGMSPSSPERTPLARQCLEREAVDIKEGLVVPPDDTPAGWRREDRLALAAKHEAAAKAVRVEQRPIKQVQQTAELYDSDTAAPDDTVSRFLRDAAAAKEALNERA